MDSDTAGCLVLTLFGFLMVVVGGLTIGECRERHGFETGQTEAVQGKFYFQALHDGDGNVVWVQTKNPTSQPVIK